MARRFTAQQSTIVSELVTVMKRMNATSLKIDQDILSEDQTATVQFDRNGVRYISKCSTYDHYMDNLRAAQLAISYTWRIIEDYGVSMLDKKHAEEILQKVFGWLEAPLDPNILMLGEGSDNWYDILGVEPTATEAAIVNAYRSLAKIHHPDVGGKPADFIRLKNAYETGIKSKQ